jgi:glycyl-tRNA synthetase beta chain
MRRAAQGAARLLVDFEQLTGTTHRPLLGPMLWIARKQIETKLGLGEVTRDEKNQLWEFFMDRLRHLMQTRGLQYEEIQAVTGDIDRLERTSPADLVDRARELASVRSSSVFAAVAEAYKRANNIVETEWKDDGDRWTQWGRNAGRLTEPAEKALREALTTAGDQISTALSARKPAEALRAIASLQPDLAKFFTEVRVVVDDAAVKEARLSLLAEVRARIHEVGDISVLVPKQA